MGNYPSLSDSDYAVMEILWREGEADSAAISKELFETFGWSRQTAGTYLKRLVEKGLVSTRKKNKRDYIYYPVVTKEEYGTDVASSQVSRYFGSLPHMVAGLMQKEEVSDREIEELERIIKKYKDER